MLLGLITFICVFGTGMFLNFFSSLLRGNQSCRQGFTDPSFVLSPPLNCSSFCVLSNATLRASLERTQPGGSLGDLIEQSGATQHSQDTFRSLGEMFV